MLSATNYIMHENHIKQYLLDLIMPDFSHLAARVPKCHKSEVKNFVNKTLGCTGVSEFSKNENFLVCVRGWREH